MSPTAELRFVIRPMLGGKYESRVLQQKWIQLHIPAGQTEAATEWRDVPAVKEQP